MPDHLLLARAAHRRYHRLLLIAWGVAMLLLACGWWKFLKGAGHVESRVSSTVVQVGIARGGIYAWCYPQPPGSRNLLEDIKPFSIRGYYSETELDDRYFRRFYFGGDENHPIEDVFVVSAPVWFPMLAVSLVFWALHLFLKRRFRLIIAKLPGSSHPSRLADQE